MRIGLNLPQFGPDVAASAIGAFARDAEGLGYGSLWVADRLLASAGVPWEGRGARLEEILDVLDAWWGPSPARHSGPRYTLPATHVERRPVQPGGPPLLLGGFGRPALERVGRRAAGWLGLAGLPDDVHRTLWDTARTAAAAAGRDPDALRRELRINVEHGQTADDAARALDDAERLGVDGAFLDLMYVTTTVPETLELADEVMRRRHGA